jgi:hypothetical protein
MHAGNTMSLKSARTLQVEAFNAVIPVWQETRSASGGLEAMDYGKNQGGFASNTACSAVVRPSKSDFSCDVEIAARRSLEAAELAWFNEFYRDAYGQIDDVPEHMAELDLLVREKLGARLLRVKIAPLGRYFQARDVRGRHGQS